MTRLRLLLVLVLVLVPRAAAPQSASQIRQAAERSTEALGVQQQLPSEAGQPRRFTLPMPGWLVRLLAWGGLIGAVLLLVVWLVDVVRRWHPGGGSPEEGTESPGVAGAMAARQQVLAGADELARAGRYAEAMHRLLLDAMLLLRKRAGSPIADSLTSREILRALALPVAEREALGDIVVRVERTWFGERPAAAEDYEAVRRSFGVLGAT